MAIAPALAAKRASGGRIFWVQVQDPRFARRDADLLVVPGHDPARGGNVLRTLGAVHRVTPARLAEGARRFAPLFAALPRPLVAVLIGGDNRVYRLRRRRFAAFADQLAALARAGYGIAITPSRRTGAETIGAAAPAARRAARLYLGRQRRQSLFRHARACRRGASSPPIRSRW